MAKTFPGSTRAHAHLDPPLAAITDGGRVVDEALAYLGEGRTFG